MSPETSAAVVLLDEMRTEAVVDAGISLPPAVRCLLPLPDSGDSTARSWAMIDHRGEVKRTGGRRPVTKCKLLLVSGSTRSESTNTAALRTIQAVAPPGVSANLYEGMVDLPAFNPDHDYEPLHSAVAELRQAISQSDAIVFCTPEYAGALPGSFKNLLDWTVGGGEIYGKPVAWINVAAEGRGANAEASLATVLGYVGAAVIEQGCIHIPVPRGAIGPDRTVADMNVRRRMTAILKTVVDAVGRAKA